MKYFNKKFVVLVFVALIFFSILPKPALAIPTWENNPVMWLYNIITAKQGTITAVSTTLGASVATATKIQQSFEWAFSIAGEALKKQLLNMMVDQIVAYIQGGGTPKFITNWPAFFRDAVDQAGGKFIQQIGLSQLCSPFKPLLSKAFIPIPTFTERTSCTLSQVGVNLDVFLKDFQSGGWVAWQEMVLKPQNNVYGAYLMAWDQYEIEKSAAAKAAEAEAQAGKGFWSARRCVESHVEDDPMTGENFTVCDKEEIVTPGAVVADAAAELVGVDIKYLTNAKDYKAYIAAITNALLNRMFAEGVGLLHSALSSEGGGGGGGGGSSAQTQCAELLGTAAYNDCITAMQTGADIKEFEKNYMISLIKQDLAYQNQLIGAKQATLFVLNQSVDILIQLQNCQGTTTLSLAKIQQVQGAASTATSQIPQIQSDIIALQIKQQEVEAITDTSQIPALWAQIAKVVNPSSTHSLVLAAQDETSQKQQEMSLYQQQLISCQTAAAEAAAGGGE